MDTEPPSLCIRESLDHLAELLHESCTGCEPQWVGRLNQHLDRLEKALSIESAKAVAEAAEEAIR